MYFNHKVRHVSGVMNLLIKDCKVQGFILAAGNKMIWN